MKKTQDPPLHDRSFV